MFEVRIKNPSIIIKTSSSIHLFIIIIKQNSGILSHLSLYIWGINEKKIEMNWKKIDVYIVGRKITKVVIDNNGNFQFIILVTHFT